MKVLTTLNMSMNQITNFVVDNITDQLPAIQANSEGRLAYHTFLEKMLYQDSSGWRFLAALDSPDFTGTPTAPTAAPGTNTTQLATTAFVQGAFASVSIADGAVTTAKLADLAVTEPKLANASVTNSKLANASVGGTKLQDNAVENTKLADMATARIKGRVTAGTGNPEDLTAAQVKTLLALGIGDIASLQAALDGKAASGHTHIASQIADFNTAVDTRVAAYWDTIAGTDANVDTIREVLDLILANADAVQEQIARFEANIGNNSATSFAVTHNLNSLDVSVEVVEASSGQTVLAGVTRTNANTVTITANPAPETNALRVVIKR